jgi:predicted RND superfamily exporter protein
VPLGLACAIFAMAMTGGSLNVYSQIGLVLLVGVMAKNGILIVEFANQLRNRGMDVRSAIEEASNIRLRPVMMTMISTVLGSVPLLLAFGAGAEARVALGWVIVGGLGLAMIATLCCSRRSPICCWPVSPRRPPRKSAGSMSSCAKQASWQTGAMRSRSFRPANKPAENTRGPMATIGGGVFVPGRALVGRG